MNEFYVYMYLREDGTPYYVGKGKDKRAYTKRRRLKVPSKDRIVFPYTNLTEEESFQKEIELIAKYGRKDIGTGILRNLTDGGEGVSGVVISEESRKKISDYHKGKLKSNYHKSKMSEAKINVPKTEKHKLKISLSKLGIKRKPFSEETKQKMRESQQRRRASVINQI